jgi:hypothetical protein
MDIKTVVLAIPFSIVLRHITNKALAEVTARWPVLQKILSRTCSKENSMLKIAFSETPTEERWILHGRLTVPWVHELWTCWKKNHRADAGCACIVDLNEVTFIDKSGERLLRILARARVQFIADGIYTKYVLDRVTSQDRAVPPANLRRESGRAAWRWRSPLNTCVDAPETKNLRLK